MEKIKVNLLALKLTVALLCQQKHIFIDCPKILTHNWCIPEITFFSQYSPNQWENTNTV